jgi:ATP-dependent Clp protease adaptor protein ClpS
VAEVESNSQQTTQAAPARKPQPRHKPQQLPPYNVVLLDDNEHTYDYVVDMLRSLFAHTEERAYRLAEQVDQTGRAIVLTTHKERAEFKCDQILGYGGDFRNPECRGSMKARVEPAEADG